MDANSILSRSQQRVVQFACAIPLKTDLKKKEREALQSYLTEADPELFQLTEEPAAQPNAKRPLFVMTRQYSVGSLLAKAPSLILAQDSLTIAQVVRIGSVKTSGDDTLQNSILNKKMREHFIKAHDLIKGLRYTRAGKIFEFTFGPFTPAEKNDVLKGLLASPNDIIGFQSQITRVVKLTEEMNVHTVFQFIQQDSGQPFLVLAKIDINNRNHKNNLDHRDIDQVFADADSMIEDHLAWLFGAAQ